MIVVGALIGVISGYFGGWIDTILMRIVDLLLAIPFFPLLLVLSQMLSQFLDSFWTIVIILSVFGWLGICRLVRGQILQGMTPDSPPASYSKKTSGTKAEQDVNKPIQPRTQPEDEPARDAPKPAPAA